MPREERKWHPRFLNYMKMIVNHPNYRGLRIETKADGTYSWIATAQSEVGKARIAWCEAKAKELGFPIQAGVYADVMLAIHPTKWRKHERIKMFYPVSCTHGTPVRESL